jgi:hypothetical protein
MALPLSAVIMALLFLSLVVLILQFWFWSVCCFGSSSYSGVVSFQYDLQ